MRKYLFIFKSEMMTNLQYVFDIFTSFIGYFIMIFIFLNLWKYMYSDPSQLINGFSMNQMIWYVVITEILWSISGIRGVCKKISDDVKGGNIAYKLNKPYNYVLSSLFEHLGGVTLKSVFYVVFGLLLGFIFLHEFPDVSVFSLIFTFLSGVLAVIINTLIVISIGLISFFIEDSNPFLWVYSKIILVLGTIFPVEFFPEKIQPILTYSPVYVTSYGPAKLFTMFSWNSCFEIFMTQIIYLFASYALCQFIYSKGVKKLNVNGG